MKFVHRLGYYIGGFIIGLIILMFFLNGKKASCAYGLDARVKKNIGLKKTQYTAAALAEFNTLKIDTASFKTLLQKADVNFSASQTKLDSCKIYALETSTETQNLKLKVQNCDSIAHVLSIKSVQD